MYKRHLISALTRVQRLVYRTCWSIDVPTGLSKRIRPIAVGSRYLRHL